MPDPHVTVEDDGIRIRYTVGSTPDADFDIPFTFYADTNIKAYNGTDIVSPNDYTVTGNPGTQGGYKGGTLSLDTPVSNTTITLFLDIAIERITDFPNSADFSIPSLNTQIDKLVSIMQILNEKLRRTLKVRVTSALSDLEFIEDPVDGRAPVYDSVGGGYKNGPNAADIGDAQGYASEAQSHAATASAAAGAAQGFKDDAEQAATDAAGILEDVEAAVGGLKVTTNDQTVKPLFEKIEVVGNASIEVLNPGADEKLRITVTAPPSAETGDTCYSYRSSKAGWVLVSARTIGSAASGATERADADCEDLFKLLWDFDPSLIAIYDSAGSPSTRGATSDDDWAANKRIALPDERGRVSVGRDDMGGVAANRITSAGSGIDGTVLGDSGGSQSHTLTTGEIPSHVHGAGTMATNTTGAHTHNQRYGTGGGSTGNPTHTSAVTPADVGIQSAGSHSHTITGDTASTGSGDAHRNVQPSIVKNAFIKL